MFPKADVRIEEGAMSANDPLRTSMHGARHFDMHCYYVLVHGTLHWSVPPSGDDVSQPRGFYCHRYVLASDEQSAAEKAFQRVRLNLDRQGRWLSDGSATLELEAEEISKAAIYRLLKPENRGHTFYEED